MISPVSSSATASPDKTQQPQPASKPARPNQTNDTVHVSQEARAAAASGDADRDGE